MDETDINYEYLEKCMIEYMNSVENKKLTLNYQIYNVYIDLLIKQHKEFQLNQLMIGLEDMQNLHIAEHLLKRNHLGDDNDEAIRLAMNVIERCSVIDVGNDDYSTIEAYCKTLVEQGNIIKGMILNCEFVFLVFKCDGGFLALRVAQRHCVMGLNATMFLKAAKDTNDDSLIKIVERFIQKPAAV